MKLHAAGEDYLEAILVLQKKQGMVRSVDVARYIEVSKPSVCYAVANCVLLQPPRNVLGEAPLQNAILILFFVRHLIV